jgi:hypothetical protein
VLGTAHTQTDGVTGEEWMVLPLIWVTSPYVIFPDVTDSKEKRNQGQSDFLWHHRRRMDGSASNLGNFPRCNSPDVTDSREKR